MVDATLDASRPDASEGGAPSTRCTAVTPLWATTFGASGSEHIARLRVGPDGTLFVGGHFDGSLTVGSVTLTSAGGRDLFVAALSPNGSPRWARSFGGPQDDTLSVLEVSAAGRELLVGGTGRERIDLGGGERLLHPNGGGFAVALSTEDGSWIRDVVLQSLGDTELLAGSLASDGRTLLAGWFWRPTEALDARITPVGRLDAFLFDLDATWSTAWGQAAGSGGWDRGDVVLWTGSGGILWGGRFDRSTDFGGGRRILPDDGDGFFVVHLAPDHSFSWDWTGLQRSASQLTGIRIGDGGTIFLAGKVGGPFDLGAGTMETTGGSDAFLVALDTTGSTRWVRVVGSSRDDEFRGLDPLPGGGVVAVGRFLGSIDFGDGVRHPIPGYDRGGMTVAWDDDGHLLWYRIELVTARATTRAVATDPIRDRVYLGGSFSGTWSVLADTYRAEGIHDAFLVALRCSTP